MIIISKEERYYMESMGFKCGEDIFKTHTSHPKYYLVASPKAIRTLSKYRSDSIIATVEKPDYGKIVRTEKR